MTTPVQVQLAPLYRVIASTLLAVENCAKSGNDEWFHKHRERLERLVADHMPSGSGFDNGTTIDFTFSTPNKLYFHTSYHHMDEGGSYDGWTDHTVVVSASLALGFELLVKGRNRNDVKDYITDVFHHALITEVAQYGG